MKRILTIMLSLLTVTTFAQIKPISGQISNITPKEFTSTEINSYNNITYMQTGILPMPGQSLRYLKLYGRSVIDDDDSMGGTYIVLTQTQYNQLKNIATKVQLVALPQIWSVEIGIYKGTYIQIAQDDIRIAEELQSAFKNRMEISAITDCFTAVKYGNIIKFTFDVDCWEHHGDPYNGRTYQKLELGESLEGGWFEIPVTEWKKLFL